MRLQKYMAQSGVASRRKSEEMILAGRVAVNNKIVTELGIKIDPKIDNVKVNGKNISAEKKKIYIMLNKPMGFVTTVSDEKDRRTILDLIEGVDERIYPVGRLDIDTMGLIILTNDGELTNKLTHPKHKVPKRYIAVVEGVPSRYELEKFRKGMKLEGKMTAPAKIKVAKRYENESILDIIIHEGRNRQVKKMCEAINHPVKKLKRVEMGELQLRGLDIGNWRYLDEDEINYLKSI